MFCILLTPLDILQTIIDFNQIEKLLVDCIKSLSRHELNKLIKHLLRLNSLTTKYNSLFVIPSPIHILRLEGDSESISILNVKTLEISINSKDMMMDIIDQFDYINDFVFICDDLSEGDYLEYFIEKLHMH
ncbi:unnamed protein product [Rotaria sordida]|uniref:Uncharacterized protein n=1 Tax=Rotaria sordida TaxID=392033 RepID=A0A819F3T8_9BILA|nr:unnamed protein product [Rotaria sordida]CAF3862376.1 unnamed protein product [Rotaria sordida]